MARMLKGQKINLRTIRRGDLETLLNLSSDIAARGDYFPLNLHTETSLNQRFDKDGFWSDESGMLLIVDQASNRMLGTVVHFKPVHYYDCVEIGYIIYNPQDRGKGIGAEAVKIFAKYLFGLKKIDRIQIQAEPGNIASRRVAEKCGFTFEGTARSAFISGGIPCDINIFSLLRSELEN